ncbi:acyl carrier protein [Allokutzneria sp. A3M-2-11 16]|uniref:acyl carrier protein n=1 Tax=Allokutzneria sp. A3M-2-11 16 TaxID=2962043 RepID=UPI0020B81612|nr:acyl carrier protein [Allokutzneria sp. A3M-2-11 16]MCP3802919.1 acyl carrier protein [Allokutzneria sp. A3M-2-11 16]
MTTAREKLLDTVVGHLRAELPLDGHQIAESDVLADLPDADSVHMFRIAARLERQFHVEFDDGSLFAVRTVGQLVDLLASVTS